MKKLLLSLLLSFGIASISYSQITITQSDMPQPGDSIRFSNTTDTTGLPTPALTGAGITWDFSALTSQSQTLSPYLNVSTTPAVYQLIFNNGFLYPAYKATVAQNGTSPANTFSVVTISDVINYYIDETANFESVGFGATINSIPTPIKDDTIDVVYNFPMNYGNSDSCHSSNHASVSGIGYYQQSQYRVNYVDGWGTLLTPYGTFSALKVKTLLYSSDSVYLSSYSLGLRLPQPEQIQYKWLANGHHAPVLQINETVNSSGATVYANTVYIDSARPSGINNIIYNNPDFKVYPNPSNGVFVVSISPQTSRNEFGTGSKGALSVDIYNIFGQLIFTQSNLQNSCPNGSSGRATSKIDLTSKPSGVYFYKVKELNGKELGSGKMVIEK